MTNTRPLSPTDTPCILVKRLQNGIHALERARQHLILSELDLVAINALINSNRAALGKAKLKIKATDAEDAKKADAELQRLGKLRLKEKKANLARKFIRHLGTHPMLNLLRAPLKEVKSEAVIDRKHCHKLQNFVDDASIRIPLLDEAID